MHKSGEATHRKRAVFFFFTRSGIVIKTVVTAKIHSARAGWFSSFFVEPRKLIGYWTNVVFFVPVFRQQSDEIRLNQQLRAMLTVPHPVASLDSELRTHLENMHVS